MNWHSSKYAPARDLEIAMGNPLEDGLFGYAHRVAEDEDERYPEDVLRWLDGWGMQQHYVPLSVGGVLQDFEVLFSLVRAVSRRDLTIAVSHAVSFLGSVGVWIAGNEAQKYWLADRLLRGDRVSLALTEREHGGDLLSCETRAHVDSQGHGFLHGEKWLINGATRNPLISVLARTSLNGGPRGFSLFLFEKRTAQSGSFECLDKVRTLGVRGGDVSGIRFHRAAVHQSVMVGALGEGFEVVLKGLQLSRLMCGAISLGATDTAFQVALDFALGRRVYGGTVFDIPQCKRLLIESWVDLWLCESMITAAARSLHFVPSEASVHSAVIKYLVPRLLDQTFRQLSIILGARYFLREEYHAGIFQKMLRDSSLVSLFDGSSIVNLYSLTTQFKALARVWKDEVNRPSDGPTPPVCDLTAPLPDFAWNGLSLTSDGQNCFIGSLRSSLLTLRSLKHSNRWPAEATMALQQQTEHLAGSADTLMTEMGAINAGSPHSVSSEAFDLACNFCVLQGAAMVLQMWLANQGQTGKRFADVQMLILALARLNACLGHKTRYNDQFVNNLGRHLLQSHAEETRLVA